MKTYRYPNCIEWKIAMGLTLVLACVIVFLDMRYRNIELKWFLIFIDFLIAGFGISKQYLNFNKLMEISFEDGMIIAKRWGGISSVIKIRFIDIIEIRTFELDFRRKGIEIKDKTHSILIGDTIEEFNEIRKTLRNLTTLYVE